MYFLNRAAKIVNYLFIQKSNDEIVNIFLTFITIMKFTASYNDIFIKNITTFKKKVNRSLY